MKIVKITHLAGVKKLDRRPVISVIVPIYNVEMYLNNCIESIINQRYTNLEIILVDDGSTDKSFNLCNIWASRDSRIKVIHKENGGLSDARNIGLQMAKGDFIAFVDSDDWIEESFLQKLYLAILQSDADIAECSVTFVDEDGKTIKERKVKNGSKILKKVEALQALILENGVYQTVWNKLYRRSVINDIFFEVGRCNEDEFWTYKVIDNAESMILVNSPLYNYRQRQSSIMGKGYTIKRLDGVLARFQRIEYLKKYEPLYRLSRQQFVIDCLWNLQSAFIYLSGNEKKYAKDYILNLLRSIGRVHLREMTLKGKYQLWILLFQSAPVFTAKLRNKLKIGF